MCIYPLFIFKFVIQYTKGNTSEERWKPAGIRGFAPTYLTASEIITKSWFWMQEDILECIEKKREHDLKNIIQLVNSIFKVSNSYNTSIMYF